MISKGKPFGILRCFIVVFISYGMVCSGQTYSPLIDTNKVWHVYEEEIYPPSIITTLWKISGDTIWQERDYWKMYRSIDSMQLDWSLYGLIREDSVHKVYFKFLADTSSRLLYDFNIKVGDSIYIPDELLESPLIVISIDTILLNGIFRKRYLLRRGPSEEISDDTWIEGIGSLLGIINSPLAGAIGKIYALLCFYEGSELVYNNPDYDLCYYNVNNVSEISKENIIIDTEQ